MKLPTILRPALWACAFALMLGLSSAARATTGDVTVHIQDSPLSSDVEPYIHNDTTYVSLSAFARSMGEHSVSWDGKTARVTGEHLDLTATPGDQWLEANGRCLYVPDQIRLVSGRTMVPVRTLAQVYGVQVHWDGETRTVSVTGESRPLEHGDTYYDPDTLFWLSRVISAESRGEVLTGQIAVGNVVLNRLNSHIFPDTLYGVIFQKDQFEPVENGTIYNEPYHLSVTAAKLCLEGADVIGPCLYFFAPDLSPGTWIVNNRTYYTTIGCHRFYL